MRAQGNGSGDVTANTTLTNSGAMIAASTATATSTGPDAEATAGAGGGEHGLFHIRSAVNGTGVDVGNASLANNAGGTITVTSTATATAFGNATATALGGDGFSTAEDTKDTVFLVQAQASGADEGTANSTITNAGTISATFTSQATSTGEDGTANASTLSNGTIRQIVEAGGPESFVGRVGTATLTNASTGTIAITARATSSAAGDSNASAQLGAAVLQNGGIIGVSNLAFNNAGTFSANATAIANSADAEADASALALGVPQTAISVGGFNAAFSNAGSFAVGATAEVDGGGDSTAEAEAVGYQVLIEPMTLNVTNSGTFTVNAEASGDRNSSASAIGMEFLATIDPTTLPPEEGGGGHGGGGGEDAAVLDASMPGIATLDVQPLAEEEEDPWEGWTTASPARSPTAARSRSMPRRPAAGWTTVRSPLPRRWACTSARRSTRRSSPIRAPSARPPSPTAACRKRRGSWSRTSIPRRFCRARATA
jgi:hypothetical protein